MPLPPDLDDLLYATRTNITKLEEAFQRHCEDTANFEDLKQQVDDAHKRADKAEANLEEVQDDVAKMKEKCERYRREAEEASDKVDDQKDEIKKLKQELAKLKQEIADDGSEKSERRHRGASRSRSRSRHESRKRHRSRSPSKERRRDRRDSRSRGRRRDASDSRDRGGRSRDRDGGGKGYGKDRTKLCIPFVAGQCFKGKSCPERHPDKEDCKEALASLQSKPCRWGNECKREDCIFIHEDGREKNVLERLSRGGGGRSNGKDYSPRRERPPQRDQMCRYGENCKRPDCYFRHP